MKASLPPLMLGSMLLSPCAAQGPFPSLSPRAPEYELTGRKPPPAIAASMAERPNQTVAPSAATDPQLPGRIAALVASAQQGQRAFEALLPQARSAVRRAGAMSSDSWIAAQQEISRLEAVRAPTADALGELESLVLAGSRDAAANGADRQRISAAAAEVRTLADSQQAEIGTLNAALTGPSALRHEPLQAPHNGGRLFAARQALAASGRGHISPAVPPRAARTGSVCQG